MIRRFVLMALALVAATPQVLAADAVIFAAASLKNALDEVAALWQAESGGTVAISYAGSSALARQIEQGAPADLFLSADLAWMDHLEVGGLIDPSSRIELLGNRIVLVAPADSDAAIKIASGFDLSGLLGEGRLAMAKTDAVPAGRYGKAALESLDVWDSVEGRLAEAENVRAALLLVSRGEAPLGIVYRTDAAADPNVRIVGEFPADSHPPIVYPAAVTAESTSENARALLAFLKSPQAVQAFERHGFLVLD